MKESLRSLPAPPTPGGRPREGGRWRVPRRRPPPLPPPTLPAPSTFGRTRAAGRRRRRGPRRPEGLRVLPTGPASRPRSGRGVFPSSGREGSPDASQKRAASSAPVPIPCAAPSPGSTPCALIPPREGRLPRGGRRGLWSGSSRPLGSPPGGGRLGPGGLAPPGWEGLGGASQGGSLIHTENRLRGPHLGVPLGVRLVPAVKPGNAGAGESAGP